MMVEFNGISVPFIPIGGNQAISKSNIEISQGLSEFQKVFADEIAKLNMSANAESSIKTNGINLSDLDKIKLESAINRAESKNAKESMIMMKDNAFIVDVPNRTIINTISSEELKSSVITGIDSAIFL